MTDSCHDLLPPGTLLHRAKEQTPLTAISQRHRQGSSYTNQATPGFLGSLTPPRCRAVVGRSEKSRIRWRGFGPHSLSNREHNTEVRPPLPVCSRCPQIVASIPCTHHSPPRRIARWLAVSEIASAPRSAKRTPKMPLARATLEPAAYFAVGSFPSERRWAELGRR